MTAKIQMRRDTKTNWDAASPSPTLAAGEIGVELNASNVPQAIKIGSGLSWANTPYFAGIPVRTATADFDTMSGAGIYHLNGTPVGITNGPSGDLALVADDGDCILIVFASDANRLQLLFTTGNGTLKQKAYSRVYDGDTTAAWRAWTPLTTWWDSNSNATSITIKDLAVKNNATVDGTLTVSGATTMNGAVTIGDADADVVTLQAGTATAPILTRNGDTNTGLYFPAANEVALTTDGTQRVRVANAGVTLANDLSVTGNATITGTMTAAAASWPQCVQTTVVTTATYATTVTTRANAVHIAALETTITPRSASSKVLVSVGLSAYVDANVMFILRRVIGGTETEPTGVLPTSPASRGHGWFGGLPAPTAVDSMHVMSRSFLDSPNTTSAVTYRLYFYSASTATANVYLNRGNQDIDQADDERGTSQMILQEFFA